MQQKTEKKPPYRIFLSSAPEDDEWCRRLMVHFQPFIRQEKLKVWHQGLVEPGISAPEERTRALQKADLIILLLTPEYLASDLYAIEDAPLVVGSQQDGGVQVVPILCKECSWEIMGLADLQRLPDTGSPVPQAGEERDAVLKQVVNDVYHLLDPDWIVPTPHSLSYDERRNRRLLLQQVRTTWIEKGGMLEQSLQRTAVHLALRLQERPDALDNPWTRQVQELVRSPHMRSPGTSILQVYDEAYGQLLILGEPGAGKTTLLLELTRDLLKRAERAEDVPMPVVFNLSSWNSQHPSFASWMIEELKSSKYQISRQVAAAWIEQHQLIPLLDGLDEVPEPLQEACMQAINAYQQEQQHSPLVVSCRSKDYEKLVSHLKLSKAVRILPLTDEQIETYLAQDQGHLDTVRTMLHQDQELLKLARQPLMLSILTLAYQNSTVADFPAYNSPEQLQRVIFADYVRCMLQRREELPSWISFTQAQSWLHTIATNLQRNKQTVFSIEDLQYDWLPKKQQRFCQWSTGLVGGSIIGVLVGLCLGLSGGLALGMIFGLVSGLFLGLGLGLDTKVEMVEILGWWPWKDTEKKSAVILFLVLLGGLGFGLTGAMVWSAGGLFWTVLGGLVWCIAGGLFPLLLYGLYFGLSRKRLIERAHLDPNEGTWRSAKNGLLVGISIVLFLGLFFGEMFAWVSANIFLGLSLGLSFGLCFGLLGLLFGLQSFLQHFILRFWLQHARILPWNLIAFLSEMTKRLLLYKAGGSYLFVHRLLLEYFASLEMPLPVAKKTIDVPDSVENE